MTECFLGFGIIVFGGFFTNLCMYLLYKNTKLCNKKYYKIHEILQNTIAPAA